MRLVPATLLVILAAVPPVPAGEDLPHVDRTGLPPRSVPEPIPARPVPEWTRTHVRVGHLPGSPAMATEFLKAGYNVVILNALGRWDAVGPSASLHPPEKVREAEGYLRAHVEKCHAAGAKAVFYVGPVQVPVGNPAFVKAHPDWLRVRPDGKPDPTPNFANIRSGYADWLFEQLAYVTREFKADGFWFDGFAPSHLHTLRRRDPEGLPDVLRREGHPAPDVGRAGPLDVLRPGQGPGGPALPGLARGPLRQVRRPDAGGGPQGEPGGRPLRQPLGEPDLVLPRVVHGRVPAPLLLRGRLLVRRATGTCPATRSTSSSSTPSCRG